MYSVHSDPLLSKSGENITLFVNRPLRNENENMNIGQSIGEKARWLCERQLADSFRLNPILYVYICMFVTMYVR